MKQLFLFLFVFSTANLFGQHKLQIVLTDNAATKAEKIYLAGSFNGWNPANAKYQFIKRADKWELTIENVAKSTYEFKCTQGSWQTVENGLNGVDISNRTIMLQADTTIYITTNGWKSPEDTKPRRHTASANVHIVSDSFYIPQLKRKRRIWIYLPANYETSKQSYPVLYMQDGQNLFDEFTAPYGEWNVDETLDSLQKITGKYAIVVGIDHGENKRGVEYDPYFSKEFGVGEGALYSNFLVQILKPFIDKKYRTKTDAAHTGIAGSSLGALISTYAILKYPNSFGSVGVFSPAYWIAPEIEKLAQERQGKINKSRFWFYGGGKEGFTMMKDMERFKKIIDKKAKRNSVFLVDENGAHNEAAWRKWFGVFYAWWYRD